ncbi:MAG: IMPACT family protein [Propioniciclava sp.]
MPLWLPAGFSHTAEVVVKRSRFLGTVARVNSEAAARDVIGRARTDHPAARHHGSAFSVDVAGAQPVERSSDDGEPAGTAGTPILETLRGAGLSNCVAVVTRYFGGVLLGAGGLARAYSAATEAALSVAPRVRPVTEQVVTIQLDPADAGRIEGALLARGVTVIDTRWETVVTLTLATTDLSQTTAVIHEIVQRPVAVTPSGTRVTEQAA